MFVPKIKLLLTCVVFITFPIMSIINVTDTLLLNLSLADIFAILLCLVWVADIRRFSIKKHFPYAWYFLLYIFIVCVANLFNMNTGIENTGITGMLAEIIKMAANAVFFFIAYNAMDENGTVLKKILLSWTAGIYIFILYGLYAFIGYYLNIETWLFNHTLANHERFLGTLTDSNAAALYLIVSFFIILVVQKYIITDKKYQVWLIATNVLIFLCIILTFSRGGMVGFFCGLIIWIVAHYKSFARYMYLIPIIFCLILSLLVIDDIFFLNDMLRRFYGRIEFTGLSARYHLSLAAVRIGFQHPVIGIGRGNFPLNSIPYLMEQGADKQGIFYLYADLIPHNTLAGIFAEMGVLGLCVFVSLFVIMALKITRQNNFSREFKIITIAIWLSIFVQSLAISLENARVLWITAGLTLCFADKKVLFEQDVQKDVSIYLNTKTKVVLITVSIIASIIMYSYLGLRFSDGDINISNTTLTLTHQAQEKGHHTLRYKVNTVPIENEAEPMQILIRKSETGEIINSEKYADRVLGYVNLYFEADYNELFIIEFTGNSISSISDIKIITPTNDTKALAGNYPLLPHWLYSYAQSNGYLQSRTPDSINALE